MEREQQAVINTEKFKISKKKVNLQENVNLCV